jgi:hypothetical protein
MNTKPLKYLGLTTAFIALNTTTSLAASGSGTIVDYHLNSAVSGRGICVKLSPALTTTWACLYKTNSLYNEITDLLRDAYISKKTCTINWSTTNNTWAVIEWVSCF